MKVNKYFLLAIILFTSSFLFSQIKIDSNNNFISFWNSFKDAVIKKNKDRVLSYTYFPFFSSMGDFYNQEKFAQNFEWIFTKEIVTGMKKAKLNKTINFSNDGVSELSKLDENASSQILAKLKLPKNIAVFHFYCSWKLEGKSSVEEWSDLYFVKLKGSFKLVANGDPRLH